MKKKKSKLRRILGFLLSAILVTVCLLVSLYAGLAPGYLAGFNVGTDPFGAFGDRHLHWWSYNETQNPRVAKFQYLKQHDEAFDSYILGGPEASGYSVEPFNEYFDGAFYNLALYDADMLASEQYCRYLVEHEDVKNIVLNVSLFHGMYYDTAEASLGEAMPYQLSGESALTYYKRYLFADPKYGKEKLQALAQNTYEREAFDVFDAKSGTFDTRQEDSVRIGDWDSYMQEHPAFQYEETHAYVLSETDNCMKSVAAIRDLCEKHDVNLVVIASPIYQKALAGFDPEAVATFYERLAEVTPYWDFTSGSVSQDPRYFYDETYFRKSVGKMVAARISDTVSAYVPDDFGVYVDGGNARSDNMNIGDIGIPLDGAYTKEVPILMYHHLVEEQGVEHWDVMTVDRFSAQLQALAQAGYTAVTFDDLRAYVNEGVDLPAKPVVITFDDGYDSNYELAVPILEELHMKASVFVIGESMGKETYKDTGFRMAPHFSWEKAREMEESGVIDIESHGYNIHEVLGLDKDPIREGCLQRDDESTEEYIQFLSEDCKTMQSLFETHIGKKANVLAYPYGYYTPLSEMIVAGEGFDITLSVEPGNSLLVQGVPQSLKAMKRHFIKEDITPEVLLQMLQG